VDLGCRHRFIGQIPAIENLLLGAFLDAVVDRAGEGLTRPLSFLVSTALLPCSASPAPENAPTTSLTGGRVVLRDRFGSEIPALCVEFALFGFGLGDLAVDQRVDGVWSIPPELPLPRRDRPTHRPDSQALMSGEGPAPRQQAAPATRTRSTSRRRIKNTPRAGMA
jgi:hypothetical protein